ncbi:MAG: hypothetical protein L0Y55_12585 [Anaerolineales bacterium]|nr:hypothetical protein [Anaerolineales bacterium]
MCHVSVGHVARLLEADGIPTVVIAVKAYLPRLEPMKIPRLIITHHPMGRPLGAPGDRARQRAVIVASLRLLETATQSGTILELNEPYRKA